jgi:hypothetical protein
MGHLAHPADLPRRALRDLRQPDETECGKPTRPVEAVGGLYRPHDEDRAVENQRQEGLLSVPFCGRTTKTGQWA